MQQQQQQDTALTIEHETLSAHHRAAGQAYFDSVVAKAQQGADPFAAEPPKKGSSTAAVAEDLHPDVAAFGAALERHKGLLLASALVVSQAFSWVLMKVNGLALMRLYCVSIGSTTGVLRLQQCHTAAAAVEQTQPCTLPQHQHCHQHHHHQHTHQHLQLTAAAAAAAATAAAAAVAAARVESCNSSICRTSTGVAHATQVDKVLNSSS
jgi:hypothetical protein